MVVLQKTRLGGKNITLNRNTLSSINHYFMRIFFISFLVSFFIGLFVCKDTMLDIWEQYQISYANVGNKPDAELASKTSYSSQPLDLYYGDSLLLGGFEGFNLTYSMNFFTPSENNRFFMEKTIDFLVQNKNANLCITATTDKSETTTSYYEREGLRRAALIKAIFLMLAKNKYLDKNQFVLNDSLTYGRSKPAVSFRLLPSAENTADFDFEKMTFFGDNFVDNDATLQPKTAFMNYTDSLRVFLKHCPNTTLTIKMYIRQKSAEKLAFQRAQTLHSYFVALGLLSHNIKLNIINNNTPIYNGKDLNLYFDIEIKTKTG